MGGIIIADLEHPDLGFLEMALILEEMGFLEMVLMLALEQEQGTTMVVMEVRSKVDITIGNRECQIRQTIPKIRKTSINNVLKKLLGSNRPNPSLQATRSPGICFGIIPFVTSLKGIQSC